MHDAIHPKAMLCKSCTALLPPVTFMYQDVTLAPEWNGAYRPKSPFSRPPTPGAAASPAASLAAFSMPRSTLS